MKLNRPITAVALTVIALAFTIVFFQNHRSNALTNEEIESLIILVPKSNPRVINSDTAPPNEFKLIASELSRIGSTREPTHQEWSTLLYLIEDQSSGDSHTVLSTLAFGYLSNIVVKYPPEPAIRDRIIKSLLFQLSSSNPGIRSVALLLTARMELVDKEPFTTIVDGLKHDTNYMVKIAVTKLRESGRIR